MGVADMVHACLPSDLPWRARARLLAAVGNTCMVLYIYIAHLVLDVEWHKFSHERLPEGGRQRLADYLRVWEFDAAFDQLRIFTFSEAMLQHLAVYMLVGTPVAITLLVLERGRVRWLQGLMEQGLEAHQAVRAVRWLEWYLRSIVVTLIFILCIGPAHLELPFAHYFCAGAALTCGSCSMCCYLFATAHVGQLAAASEDQQLLVWAARVQHTVRPVLKFVLLLHVLAAGAGALKSERLGDDRSALLFGVLETSVILGYQLFQGVFVVDDVIVGWRPRPALGTQGPGKKGSPPKANEQSPGASDKLLDSCEADQQSPDVSDELLGS